MSRRTHAQAVDEMRDVIRAYQAATDALDETAARLLGINRTDARCWDIIDRAGPITAGDLARQAQLTTGAVTGVVDRLEARGFVRRVRDEGDRRKVLVEITDEARTRAYAIYGAFAEHGERELKRWSIDDLDLVIAFLRMSTAMTDRVTTGLRDRTRAGDEP